MIINLGYAFDPMHFYSFYFTWLKKILEQKINPTYDIILAYVLKARYFYLKGLR